MWPSKFEQRLSSWNSLRSECGQLDAESALTQINQWWQNAPWRAYHLHWDDRATWPDPWQLLSDNIYCDLAKGLGIMYTLTLLDHAKIQNSCLVETDVGNLVLVDNEKYILNWGKDIVVNTNHKRLNDRHILQQQDLKNILN